MAWTIKQYVIAGVAAVLALGLAYSAGRYTAPVKVIKTEEIKKEEETKKEEAKKVEVKEVIKWKTRTVVKHQTQFASAVDLDTKCDETFDKDTGKLVHRICEKHLSKDASGSSQGGSSTVSEGEKKTELALQEARSEITKLKEEIKRKEESTYSKPDWAISLRGSIQHDPKANPLTLTLKDVKLGGSIQRRILGGFYLGIEATPELRFYGVIGTLVF